IGTHRPLSHFLTWYVARFGHSNHERFSLLSGLGYDPLLRDIFTPLWIGASLFIPGSKDLDNGGRLAEWMNQKAISIVHLTPALGQLIYGTVSTRRGCVENLDSLRYAFYGGDVLRQRDVTRLRALAPNAQCVNFYGTTETPQGMGYYIVPSAKEGV